MIEQSIYNLPNSNLFYAGVPYNLNNVDGTRTTIQGIPVVAYFLPKNWYYNCFENGSSPQISSFENSIKYWTCLSNSETPNFCSNLPNRPKQAWTTSKECEIGDKYLYCLQGMICGMNNCKGKCQSSDYSCDYNNPGYICTKSDNGNGNGSFFTSVYFAFLVVLTIVSVILIGLIIYFV